jgi:glutathione synthase/RimK-type ligase-like ATP-grasp enzyme
MTFYNISGMKNSTTNKLLKKSCEERNITYVYVDIENFDYTNPPTLAPHDLLYRTGTHTKATYIEQLLIEDHTVTFHKNKQRKIMTTIQETILYQKLGLPTPKTVYDMPQDEKLMTKTIDFLGGFPIILKIPGRSHSEGIIKVDSITSLKSVVDYIQPPKMMLREYIDFTSHARLIVIGNRVVDSIEYIAPDGDFRSNVGTAFTVKAKTFSSEIQKIAVDAVALSDVEFGGVDILIDANGNPYLTEVNFPCFFPRAQHTTGTDISGMMIDYLVTKRNSKK